MIGPSTRRAIPLVGFSPAASLDDKEPNRETKSTLAAPSIREALASAGLRGPRAPTQEKPRGLRRGSARAGRDAPPQSGPSDLGWYGPKNASFRRDFSEYLLSR